MLRRLIYLDHAATTPVHPEVLAAMLPYFSEEFGNPGGLYALGQRAREAVEDARRRVAQVLGCTPAEIVFTSGGTESNNLALRGAALAWQARRGDAPPHIITSAIEHHAVLTTCHDLRERWGVEITELSVDRNALVDPDAVRRAIRPNTALISVMYANNEVGTIQPIAEIGRIARERGIPFHTDAVQAAPHLPVNVGALNADLLSLGAHKFYGPKGVGALYVRRGTPLAPLQTGGGQESDRRAGTENVSYIVGLATALELAQARVPDAAMPRLRDRLLHGVPELVRGAQVTGHPTLRLPNNASFAIEGVEAGALLAGLDVAGIAASSGSACTSAAQEPSHVLTAMGVPPALAHGALRLTVGTRNTMDEIDAALETVAEVVARLRKLEA